MTAMKKRPWWHAILAKTSEEENGSFVSLAGNAALSNALNPEDDDLLQYQPSFIWEMYRNSIRYKQPALYKNVMLNHIQKNSALVTKKGLYLSMKAYCLANNLDMMSIVPLSFYLAPGEHSKSMKDDDLEEFSLFCEKHSKEEGITPNEINFIMKPASKTNRGFGIKVVKGMSKVLTVVQRGLSACSDRGSDENDTCNPSLETSMDDDNASVTKDPAPNSPSHQQKNKSKKITTTMSMKGEKKEIDKGNDNNNDKMDKTDKNLTKAAKKIAQQDGYIVQLYLNQPLLVHGRKFDIRCYVLTTVTPAPKGSESDKVVKAWFFEDAYIRTSSKKYNLSNLYDREVHLTNDAVQKNSSSYGKFESGNKLSLTEWQEVILADLSKTSKPGDSSDENGIPPLPSTLPSGVNASNIVFSYIFPEIKKLCRHSIAACEKAFATTDIPKSFELFGYDFMILNNYQPILIEVNTNPCLEFVNPLLTNIITTVIEQSIRMTVDKEFPPPPKSVRTKASEEAIQAIESEPLKFEPLYP
jgi:hypothetical protein